MQENSPKLELDAERTALLVIDVQRALFSRPIPIYKAENLIHNINSLQWVNCLYPAFKQQDAHQEFNWLAISPRSKRQRN